MMQASSVWRTRIPFALLVVGAMALALGRGLSREPSPPVPGVGSATGASAASRLDGVVDLSGRARDPFSNPTARAVVLIFVSIECPICGRYAPEIQQLQARFSKQDVAFWFVQPADDESPEATRRYLKEFGYSMDLVRDPKRVLVQRAGATITPEAAVFLPDGTMAYRGRIDDRYADFGKTRPAPTRRELADALESILAGRPVAVTNAPAVGCSISR